MVRREGRHPRHCRDAAFHEDADASVVAVKDRHCGLRHLAASGDRMASGESPPQ